MYSLGPAGEPINASQQVGLALAEWQGTNKVEMYSIKMCVRRRKWNERCGSVALYLGSLALGTGSGPLADVQIDARPYIPGNDEFLGCSDSRVRELMQRVENDAAETLRHERARVAS